MPSYTTSYTKETTLRVAKRYRNAKRAYLLVNPLQAKHMPVSPTEALTMMRTLGEGLRQEFPGARLVLGFAETATALGAAVASRLGPDCAFLTTTREAGEGPGWVRFLEEHSHAAEQKLWGGDLDALLQKTDTVLFVDDEISTGKTLRNMVAQLTRRWPALGEKTLVAASLLNRVTPEQEKALADAGITCRCLVRLPQEDHTAQVADWTVTEAPPAVPQNLSFRQETLPGEGLLDPRKTLRIGAYDSNCQAVGRWTRWGRPWSWARRSVCTRRCAWARGWNGWGPKSVATLPRAAPLGCAMRRATPSVPAGNCPAFTKRNGQPMFII